MLVNNTTENASHVKFIEYTGEYPCLCMGELILEIDGERVKFGYNEGCDYPRFWYSGGHVHMNEDYDYDVTKDEWEIDVKELPEHYKKYASEIDTVFNDNVRYGCCGGCI